MGGMSPSVAAGASHHSTMTPQMAKGKEKLSDALKSCNEILKELFSKKHSVSFMIYTYRQKRAINYFFRILTETQCFYSQSIRIFIKIIPFLLYLLAVSDCSTYV